jgi:hypothetical protein
MAANRNFTNFRAVYDDSTDEVSRSSEQFLADHLENWFSLIDETPGVREVVRELEAPVYLSFLTWFNELTGPGYPLQYGRQGEKKAPAWPAGTKQRLGMQLGVFRKIAQRQMTAQEFGQKFLRSGSENERAKQVVEQIFLPMARELRRRLEAELGDREDLTIPEADKTMPLDRESAKYKEAIEALETLERILLEANDYPDAEDKEQRVAEVSAIRRLLESPRVRLASVVVVAKSTLGYLAKKFVDAGIGKAAAVGISKLAALLGWPL